MTATATTRSKRADQRPDPTLIDHRRYPGAPLLHAVTLRYGSIHAVSHNLSRCLHRINRTGLSAHQADRWAIRLLGKHPTEIWADWGQPEQQEAA